MAVNRNKERIDRTGEIFTPPMLIEEMLDLLSPDAFFDDSKTFCDPACGDGNFLVEILLRKLKNGHDVSVALSTIYGMDIMEDNVQECRNRLLEIAASQNVNKKQEYINILKKNILVGNSLGAL